MHDQYIATHDTSPCSPRDAYGQLAIKHGKWRVPVPREDFRVESIDLDQILMTHSQATFFMRAIGDSMVEFGIKHARISNRT